MSLSRNIRILHIEDSERDAAHVKLMLRRAGYEPDVHRVETRDELRAALAEQWDVILSDYNMPGLGAAEALAAVRELGVDTPFIVVSGAIGEDTAVEMMRSGAHDYVLKDRLTRLTAAIEREIDQAEQRRARRRTETMFQAVLKASPFPSAVIDRSNSGVIDCTDAFARDFLEGVAPGDSPSILEVVRFTHPERIEQLLKRGSGTAWYVVYYVNDISRIANVRCYSVQHEGAAYTYIVLEDVTEPHYLKAAFDAIPDAVLIIGSDQRLLYGNHAAEQLFGSLYFRMEVERILNLPSADPEWWMQIKPQEEQRLEINGNPYAASSVVFRFAGETNASAIVTIRNLAEQQQLIELATHDALTGLFNVRHFDRVLADYVSGASEGSHAALALLDLDYFKPINDELGHAAGDAALSMFAHLVRDELRSTDVFARVGGDEFAVLFPGSGVDEAATVLNRVYRRLQQSPLQFDGSTKQLSASAGLAPVHCDDTPLSVKQRADRALYTAKREGRGRVAIVRE